MAGQDSAYRDGSWAVAEKLFEHGDAAFVDELRSLHTPEQLGSFAARWLADARPAARRLLFQYLALPLNAFRHEPLVKRLFKLAEKAGDDAVMAHFMTAFDRSVRRKRRKRSRYDRATRQSWREESIAMPPGSTMPRSDGALRYRNPRTGERMPAPTEEKRDRLRLFSVHTRYYLRRRAWRYFRKLGKEQPSRYLPAVVEALAQYTDADVGDGLQLIDNWGLMHVMFHHCPALVARANGWTLAPGRALAELAPAPAFEALWRSSAESVVEVLISARCRPVRQWAIQMLRKHHPDAMALLPLPKLLALLAHEDAELAALAVEALRKSPTIASLTIDEWLSLLDRANPMALDVLCEMMVQRIDASAITLTAAVRLACSRLLPVARLGVAWLQAKRPATPEECRAVLGLAEAEAGPARAEAVRWARGVLSASEHFDAAWVVEFLDSRHADVRAEGWTWFLQEPRASDNVQLWQRLLESPYDDLRLRFVAILEEMVDYRRKMPIDQALLEPGLVRYLWASVLLNIHRGGRSKPFVVAQMVRRLERRPQEAASLLPILAVALRSVRGPEFRAGLAGVVQLVERSPETEPAVRAAFPELRISVS